MLVIPDLDHNQGRDFKAQIVVQIRSTAMSDQSGFESRLLILCGMSKQIDAKRDL